MHAAATDNVKLMDVLLRNLPFATNLNRLDNKGRSVFHWAAMASTTGPLLRLLAEPELQFTLLSTTARGINHLTPSEVADSAMGMEAPRVKTAFWRYSGKAATSIPYEGEDKDQWVQCLGLIEAKSAERLQRLLEGMPRFMSDQWLIHLCFSAVWHHAPHCLRCLAQVGGANLCLTDTPSMSLAVYAVICKSTECLRVIVQRVCFQLYIPSAPWSVLAACVAMDSLECLAIAKEDWNTCSMFPHPQVRCGVDHVESMC